MQDLNVPRAQVSEGGAPMLMSPLPKKAMNKLPLGQSHLSWGHQANTPPHCLAAAQRRVSEIGSEMES